MFVDLRAYSTAYDIDLALVMPVSSDVVQVQHPQGVKRQRTRGDIKDMRLGM
jgi:hypothetical protein